MIKFKATESKNNKIIWLIYILIGICLLVYIFKYSDWHFIFKFIVSIPLIINMIFDYYYLKKENYVITELNFDVSEIVVIDQNNTKRLISYSNLKYSIRKRKFDKDKIEIELKTKKGLLYKTFGRVHIKNWDNIFEIENELKNNEVVRTEWKPKTLWSRYWGIFIDLFFIVSADGDVGMTEYQMKSEEETTENPLTDKD